MITLEADFTKGRSRRIVRMEPNLVEWLMTVPERQGPVTGPRHRERTESLRRAMGWAAWPKDVLRHSYGSYHLAHFRSAGDTAEQMGHQSSVMLHRHYREVVEPSAAAEYWAITPSNVRAAEAKVLEF